MKAGRRPGGPILWMTAGGVAALGIAAYFGIAALPDAENGGLSDAMLAAEGERIYADFCASCHGADLEGQPNWRTPLPTGGLPAPPHDETGHTWHHPDRLLFAITKFGGQQGAPVGFQSNMPAFGNRLTEQHGRKILAACALPARFQACGPLRIGGCIAAQINGRRRALEHVEVPCRLRERRHALH